MTQASETVADTFVDPAADHQAMGGESVGALGRVYGKALLELAEDQNQTDTTAEEVQDLARLYRDNAQLRELFESPAVSTRQRADSIDAIFQGKVSDTLYKFLRVLNRKGRLNALPQIIRAFNAHLAEQRGIVEVDAYVAEKLDQEAADRIAESLGSAMGDKTVVLRQHVDESLIGGLKLRVGDQLVDGSVAAQLRLMRRRLTEAARQRNLRPIEENSAPTI